MDLFTEMLFSRGRLETPFGPLIDAFGGSFGGTTLGANNPYNPFGKDVGVSFAYPGRQVRFIGSGTLIRPLIGVRGAFFSEWHYEATAYFSRDRSRIDQDAFLNQSNLQAALNSSDSATALNPFTAGAPGTLQAVQSLLATVGPPMQTRLANQILDGQGVLRGPLFWLPAGAVEAAIGSEYSGKSKKQKIPVNRRWICAAIPMRHLPKLGFLCSQDTSIRG